MADRKSYSYDRNILAGLGTGAFLGEVRTREKRIASAPAEEPAAVFQANRLAASLHPAVQHAKIARVTELSGGKSYTLVPDAEKGTEKLAFFRAGQYVSVSLRVDGAALSRPYTIQSGPQLAQGAGSAYRLTVKRVEGGFASEYILGSWKEGGEVTLSGPQGDFYYQRLRDAGEVVGIAGGSGITPFASMASAICAGEEDFRLTILYGSRTHESILLDSELVKLAIRSGGRLKVIHVLSDDPTEGFEHGFISADIIRRYAPKADYSVFVSGPKALYAYEREEIAKLGLPARRVRFALSGEYGDPAGDGAFPDAAVGQTFSARVWIRGGSREVACPAGRSLLSSLEAAGIPAPSRCRSGRCGCCRSRLIQGDVYIPASQDGRRGADRKFGWIHPCSAYPLSDLELEIFPQL